MFKTLIGTFACTTRQQSKVIPRFWHPSMRGSEYSWYEIATEKSCAHQRQCGAVVVFGGFSQPFHSLFHIRQLRPSLSVTQCMWISLIWPLQMALVRPFRNEKVWFGQVSTRVPIRHDQS